MSDVRVRLARTLCGVTVLLAVAQVVILLRAEAPLFSAETLDDGFPLVTLATVVASVVGVLIVSRYPRHRVGWLFLVGQVGTILGLVAQSYAFVALTEGTASRTVGQWTMWVSLQFGGGFALTLVALLLLLAPDGRLLSPRWRWAVGVVLLGIVVQDGAALLVDPHHLTAEAEAPGTPSVVPLLALGGGVLLVAGLVCGAVSLVRRLRRATGVERAQLRWIAAAATALALSLPGGDPALAPARRAVLGRGRPADGRLPRAPGLHRRGDPPLAPLRHRRHPEPVDRALPAHRLRGPRVRRRRGGPGRAGPRPGCLAVVRRHRAGRGRLPAGAPPGHPTWRTGWSTGTARRPTRRWPASPRSSGTAARRPSCSRAPRRRSAGCSGPTACACGSRLAEQPPTAAEWPAGGSRRPAHEEVVPVVESGERLGGLAVTTPRGRPLRRAEVRLLEDLAAQLGPAFRAVQLERELAERVHQLGRQGGEAGRVPGAAEDGPVRGAGPLRGGAGRAGAAVRPDVAGPAPGAGREDRRHGSLARRRGGPARRRHAPGAGGAPRAHPGSVPRPADPAGPGDHAGRPPAPGRRGSRARAPAGPHGPLPAGGGGGRVLLRRGAGAPPVRAGAAVPRGGRPRAGAGAGEQRQRRPPRGRHPAPRRPASRPWAAASPWPPGRPGRGSRSGYRWLRRRPAARSSRSRSGPKSDFRR